jgi:hypothetical protein
MATPLDDYAYRQKAASKRLSSVMTEDERKMSEYDEKKKQQKSKGMVGGAIGGVAGAYFGGPKGAAAGYQVGSAITGGADPEKPRLTGDGAKKVSRGNNDKPKKKDNSAAITKGLGALGKLTGGDDETDGGAHPPPARSTADQDKKNKEDEVDFGAIANLIRAAYMSKGS